MRGQSSVFYRLRKPDDIAFHFFIEKGADLHCVDTRCYTPLSYVNTWIYQAGLISFPGFQEYSVDIERTVEILRIFLKENYCVFVVSDGQDINSGSEDFPSKAINSALDIVKPGDSVILRGGVYHMLRPICVTKSGTSGKPICIVGYPGEIPSLDFSRMKGRAFFVEGSFCHFKNSSITGVEFWITLCCENSYHNVLERLTIHHSRQGVMLLVAIEGAAYISNFSSKIINSDHIYCWNS